MDLVPLATNPKTPDAEHFEIVEPLCSVFRRKLRAEGLKYTPERARILDAILKMDEVFEAEQLLARLRAGFRVSRATVYRTIKLLAEAGIIQQVLFDAEQTHYQLAWGGKAAGLLIMMDTRETRSVQAPELIAIRDRICRELGVTPRGHRFVIYASKS